MVWVHKVAGSNPVALIQVVDCLAISEVTVVGATTWMLAYADGDARSALAAAPALDRERTFKFACSLFPGETLKPLEDGTLSYTCPPDNEIHAGCFPGVSVIAAKEFGIDRPSALDRRYIAAAGRGTVTLHAMHSVVDWFAFAQWSDGTLVRSLSLSPDSGIIEDIGAKLPFEVPYWAGEQPAVDPEDDDHEYPFPFHPLELGEAALNALLGYQLEGALISTLFDADSIPLMRFARARARWKFWR